MMDTVLESISFELKMSKNDLKFTSFENICHSNEKTISKLEIYDFYFRKLFTAFLKSL